MKKAVLTPCLINLRLIDNLKFSSLSLFLLNAIPEIFALKENYLLNWKSIWCICKLWQTYWRIIVLTDKHNNLNEFYSRIEEKNASWAGHIHPSVHMSVINHQNILKQAYKDKSLVSKVPIAYSCHRMPSFFPFVYVCSVEVPLVLLFWCSQVRLSPSPHFLSFLHTVLLFGEFCELSPKRK